MVTMTIISSPDPKGQVSYCHHWSSVVRPLTFHILINSSEATIVMVTMYNVTDHIIIICNTNIIL
jgi:oxalate decarboxylase/phosphoglucose isomerase-like protein (cupin superfamily)